MKKLKTSTSKRLKVKFIEEKERREKEKNRKN